jgi:hypothetical protein
LPGNLSAPRSANFCFCFVMLSYGEQGPMSCTNLTRKPHLTPGPYRHGMTNPRAGSHRQTRTLCLTRHLRFGGITKSTTFIGRPLLRVGQ